MSPAFVRRLKASPMSFLTLMALPLVNRPRHTGASAYMTLLENSA
jgi:hypothetical protein